MKPKRWFVDMQAHSQVQIHGEILHHVSDNKLHHQIWTEGYRQRTVGTTEIQSDTSSQTYQNVYMHMSIRKHCLDFTLCYYLK